MHRLALDFAGCITSTNQSIGRDTGKNEHQPAPNNAAPFPDKLLKAYSSQAVLWVPPAGQGS